MTDRDLLPADFPITRRLTTRWSDNDSYGHMNNAVHYQLFDSVINAWLAEELPDFRNEFGLIGVVAESRCSYFAELSYPHDVLVGLRVERIGATSVTYGLGLYPILQSGSVGPIAAKGTWVHVYVDHVERRPARMPNLLRGLLDTAAIPSIVDGPRHSE